MSTGSRGLGWTGTGFRFTPAGRGEGRGPWPWRWKWKWRRRRLVGWSRTMLVQSWSEQHGIYAGMVMKESRPILTASPCAIPMVAPLWSNHLVFMVFRTILLGSQISVSRSLIKQRILSMRHPYPMMLRARPLVNLFIVITSTKCPD